MSSPSSSHPRKSKLQEQDRQSDELIVEIEDLEDEDSETLVAASSSNGSLTLLEEYKLQKNQSNKKSFFIALTCAAASLTFAVLSFQKL